MFRPLAQADRPTLERLFPQLPEQSRFRRSNSLFARLSVKQLNACSIWTTAIGSRGQ